MLCPRSLQASTQLRKGEDSQVLVFRDQNAAVTIVGGHRALGTLSSRCCVYNSSEPQKCFITPILEIKRKLKCRFYLGTKMVKLGL